MKVFMKSFKLGDKIFILKHLGYVVFVPTYTIVEEIKGANYKKFMIQIDEADKETQRYLKLIAEKGMTHKGFETVPDVDCHGSRKAAKKYFLSHLDELTKAVVEYKGD